MKYRMVLALTFCLLLSGCGIDIPAEKQNYVGQWQGLGMSLLITSDGTVAYERKQGGGSTSINAPLQEFQGDNFVVGIAFYGDHLRGQQATLPGKRPMEDGG